MIDVIDFQKDRDLALKVLKILEINFEKFGEKSILEEDVIFLYDDNDKLYVDRIEIEYKIADNYKYKRTCVTDPEQWGINLSQVETISIVRDYLNVDGEIYMNDNPTNDYCKVARRTNNV